MVRKENQPQVQDIVRRLFPLPLDWVSWKCKSDPDQCMKVVKMWNDLN